MKRNITILLLALIFVGSSIVSAFGEEWYAFQKDESRSGMVKETLYFPMKNQMQLSVGETISGGLLVHNNCVYYSTLEGTVGCTSIFSGETQWKQSLSGPIKSSMMISNRDLFAITEKGHVYCMDAQTGTILWNRNLDTEVEAPLLKFYRYLIVPCMNGQVYSLNGLDGKTIWNIDLHEPIRNGVCLKFNSLYIVTERGQIGCYDSQNGKKYWSFYAPSASHSAPIAGTECIYYGDDQGHFYAYDYITGRKYWTKEFNSPFSSPMSFCYFDKRIVCTGITDRYSGISVGTGAELWSYKSSSCTIAPVAANRVVFIPGSNNTIVAIDSFDGTEIYKEQLDSPISAGMAISNGRLFIGTEDGTIHIFGSADYDFYIELDEEIKTISPGESCSFKIKVVSKEGFHDPVSFSAGGFPCSCKGVGRYFDHSQVKPPGEINLIVDTTTEAKPAKYRITIKAFSGKRDIEREAYGILIIQEKGKETILSMETPETVKDGQEFKVPIHIQNADQLRSIGYTIQYPSEHLLLKEVQKGDFFLGPEDNIFFNSTNNPSNGKVSINYSRKELGESGSGYLAYLVFQAIKPTKEKESISLTFTNVSLRDTLLFSKAAVFEPASLQIEKGKQVKILLQIGSKTVKINNRTEQLSAAPYIKDGRTLVPLRVLAENMNTTVEWIADEQKIVLSQYDKTIVLWIQKPICEVNGVPTDLPNKVAPEIKNGRTFIPLRFVAEQLNGSIQWDGTTQTITILYPNYD